MFGVRNLVRGLKLFKKKKVQTSHQISHFKHISLSILFHCVTSFVNLWRAKGRKLVKFQKKKKKFKTLYQFSQFKHISLSIWFHCVTSFVNLWRAKGQKLVGMKKQKVSDLAPDFTRQTYKCVYLVSLCNFLCKPLTSKRMKTSSD